MRIAKIIRRKFAEPLSWLAAIKTLDKPAGAEAAIHSKFRPDRCLTKDVECRRLRHANLGMFSQAAGEPRGACFGRAYPDKIELDIVHLHFFAGPAR